MQLSGGTPDPLQLHGGIAFVKSHDGKIWTLLAHTFSTGGGLKKCSAAASKLLLLTEMNSLKMHEYSLVLSITLKVVVHIKMSSGIPEKLHDLCMCPAGPEM